MLTRKNLPKSVFGLYLGKRTLIVSLKAKLKAWVGKYLRTFVKFPLQNDLKPYSELILLKQSTIPLYLWISPEIIFGLAS